jgi:hypothetical protein
MRLKFLVPLAAALMGAAILVLDACGGGGTGTGSNPTSVTPTPTPVPSPTPTPRSALPSGMVCDPTPPPLYGINVKVEFESGGARRTLDSRPIVINVDNFCEKAGFATTAKFCFTRQEGDPQATACDYLAVGKAADTGRWGPTWYYNGKLCSAAAGEDGCSNHPDNQFLVVTRGDGTYEACAADDIPLSKDPEKPGSRCGSCTITGGSGPCQ